MEQPNFRVIINTSKLSPIYHFLSRGLSPWVCGQDFFPMYPLSPLVLGAEDNLYLFSSELWQDWAPVPVSMGKYELSQGLWIHAPLSSLQIR